MEPQVDKLVDNRNFMLQSLNTCTCTKDFMSLHSRTILKVPKIKIVEFANNIDPDKVAHIEPPHLDLWCLPLRI